MTVLLARPALGIEQHLQSDFSSEIARSNFEGSVQQFKQSVIRRPEHGQTLIARQRFVEEGSLCQHLKVRHHLSPFCSSRCPIA